MAASAPFALLAALAAALALALAWAPERSGSWRAAGHPWSSAPDGGSGGGGGNDRNHGNDGADVGHLRRARPVWAGLAAAGAWAFIGGPAGLVAAVPAGAAVWVIATRAEPPSVRRRREQARRELPQVAALLADALRAGTDPASALGVVCRALPGPAVDRLAPVATRLALGADPVRTWGAFGDDPALGALGRALARAYRTGAPVAEVMERLSVDLARSARAEVEDRARTVGVRAAIPLGVCLLPAFVLLGIVPLVAGLFGSLRW